MSKRPHIGKREAEKIKESVAREYQRKLEEWTVLPQQDHGVKEYGRRFEDKFEVHLRDTYEIQTGLSWWLSQIGPLFICAGMAVIGVLGLLKIVPIGSVWSIVLILWGFGAAFGFLQDWRRMKGQIQELRWKSTGEINRRLQASYENVESKEPLLTLFPSINTLQIRVSPRMAKDQVEAIEAGGRFFALMRNVESRLLFKALDMQIRNTRAYPRLSSVINKRPHMRAAVELIILEALLKEAGLQNELAGELEEKKRQAFANEQVQHSYVDLKKISNELKLAGKSITDFGIEKMRALLLASEKPTDDDAT